jgi:hypothetical protein
MRLRDNHPGWRVGQWDRRKSYVRAREAKEFSDMMF